MNLTAEHLAELMIFPLPDLVLFPHTEIPLHVFEPRYRQLVNVAIRDSAPIAMATLRESDSEPPDVHPQLGVGFITAHEKLEDGRFVIVLEGVGRARIVEEVPSGLMYRTVAAEAIADIPENTLASEATMSAIQGLLPQLALVNDRIADFITEEIDDAEGDASVFAHRAGGLLCASTTEKLNLLRETDPNARLDFVLARISEIMVLSSGSQERN